MYLFDDVLAAVDAPVAACLLRHALTGPLLAGKTRILVSHAPAAAAAADTLVPPQNTGSVDATRLLHP